MNDSEIEALLHEDGMSWRIAREAGPRLDEAIASIASGPAIALAGQRGGRRHRWVAPLATAAAVVVIAGLTVGLAQGIHKHGTTSGSPSPLSSCGVIPVSNGPHARSVELTLTAPTAGRSGTLIKAMVSLRNLSGESVEVDTTMPPDLLITRNGVVVGRYGSAVAGLATSIALMQGGATSVPATVELSGCAPSPSAIPDPNSVRSPLPPGEYQLVATIEDQTLGHQTSGQQLLVSSLVNITISA